MHYEGENLYWLITPKTSFDDVAAIRQALAKYGQTARINQLAYAPLDAYISRIVFTLEQPNGNILSIDEDETDKEEWAFAGVAGPKATNSRIVAEVHPFPNFYVPDALKRVIAEDKVTVSDFLTANRLKYMIGVGTELSKKYGNTLVQLPGKVLTMNNKLNTSLDTLIGVRLDKERIIRVTDTSVTKALFINNKPATPEAVSYIDVDKLSTVLIRRQDVMGEKHTPNALLFYTSDN